MQIGSPGEKINPRKGKKVQISVVRFLLILLFYYLIYDRGNFIYESTFAKFFFHRGMFQISLHKHSYIDCYSYSYNFFSG